jgi:hypothetical protein
MSNESEISDCNQTCGNALFVANDTLTGTEARAVGDRVRGRNTRDNANFGAAIVSGDERQ